MEHHPYLLVMRREIDGTRRYTISRAEELVLEHVNSEHLDLFFRRLVAYLNRDSRGVIALEDKIIQMTALNKGMSNLVRLLLRKLAWACQGMREKKERDYVSALIHELRKTADEMRKGA